MELLKLDSGGNCLWVRGVGGAAGFDGGFGIGADAAGSVYVGGGFNGSVDIGSGTPTTSVGGRDIFALKLDSAGNFLWSRTAGTTGLDQAFGLALDASGNPHLAGFFNAGTSNGSIDFGTGVNEPKVSAGGQDAFVWKLDTNGTSLWAATSGGATDDRFWAVAVDGAGNVLSTGNFTGTADFDPGPGTFNLSGGALGAIPIASWTRRAISWAKSFDGTYSGIANGIAADASRNVYTTGNFRPTAPTCCVSVTVDFDPGASTAYLTAP